VLTFHSAGLWVRHWNLFVCFPHDAHCNQPDFFQAERIIEGWCAAFRGAAADTVEEVFKSSPVAFQTDYLRRAYACGRLEGHRFLYRSNSGKDSSVRFYLHWYFAHFWLAIRSITGFFVAIRSSQRLLCTLIQSSMLFWSSDWTMDCVFHNHGQLWLFLQLRYVLQTLQLVLAKIIEGWKCFDALGFQSTPCWDGS